MNKNNHRLHGNHYQEEYQKKLKLSIYQDYPQKLHDRGREERKKEIDLSSKG